MESVRVLDRNSVVVILIDEPMFRCEKNPQRFFYFNPERKPICDSCQKLITTFWVSRRDDFYRKHHLDCFHPGLDQPINPRDIEYNFDKDNRLEIFGIVNHWVKNWNSRFIPLRYTSTTPSHFRRRLKDFPIKSKSKRARLEIFKFISPLDWARIASTCKEFYQISWEEELWKHTDIQNSSKGIEYLRISYISQYACYECGQYIEGTTLWCPLMQRHICVGCRYNKKKFKLIPKSQLKGIYNVNPNTLQLIYGTSQNQKYVYHFVLEEELKRMRIRNKQAICRMFKLYIDLGEINDILECINDEDGKTSNNSKEVLSKNKYFKHFDEIQTYVNTNSNRAKLLQKLKNNIENEFLKNNLIRK